MCECVRPATHACKVQPRVVPEEDLLRVQALEGEANAPGQVDKGAGGLRREEEAVQANVLHFLKKKLDYLNYNYVGKRLVFTKSFPCPVRLSA